MREIVEDILNSFDIKKFEKIFREKCRDFSFIYEDLNNYNSDIFTDGLKIGEGKIQDGNEILITAFKVKKDLTERSGKKAQYELGKKILKDYMRYAGGFFIFYDEKGDFRFSFIYSKPLETGKRDWSSFRRYTYFVSKELTNNTFIKQLKEADFTNIDGIIEAFSVDKVTKEFYKELSNWYYWVMDIVEFPEDDELMKDKEIRNATNLIRLITRIIFIWFLKVKKLIPDILFQKEKLTDIIVNFFKNKESNNYYNAILQNLFFGTLNQQIKERKFAREGDINENKEEYGIKNIYRYANKFLIKKDDVIKLFSQIPFLNGGLFDCLDKYNENGKQIYVDGFSRNPKKQAKIPDYVFFMEDIKEINLSKYGFEKDEKIRGLFEIFKSYNFTIDENSIIDQEVALDPELLGKVFENLLASYNPETKESARKSTGSYYTPREIVDYMCEQSIIEYFKVKLPEMDEEKIKIIVSYNDEKIKLEEEIKRKIINLIADIKILDPACGSGAFPMGILHKLVYILEKLDPDNKIWQEIQYEKAMKETEETFKIGDKKEREERLKEINETFDENMNYPDYARKLYLIENCIFGVDIQPIAIHISKLRFFISLIIDQKIDKSKENFGIKPLPNLETKFVAANTLIGLEKPQQMNLRNPDIDKKEKELKEIRHKYFLAKTRKQKIILQERDKELREEIAELLKKDGWGDQTAIKIVEFNPYDLNKSCSWFDPEWMFGVKDGFDVIIGNPPYGDILTDDNKKIINDTYKYSTVSDISSPFIEKGVKLLKKGGNLIYIITYAITFNKDFSKNRYQLYHNFEKIIIFSFDRDKCRIFESMTQSVSILNCFNYNSNCRQGIFTSKMFRDTPDINKIEVFNADNYLLPIGTKYSYKHRLPKLGEKINVDILNKILSHKNKLGYVLGGEKTVWIRTSGNYWYNAWDKKPYKSSKIKKIFIKDKIFDFFIILLNSSMFYFWFRIYGDGRDMNMDILKEFRMPDLKLIEERSFLLRKLRVNFLNSLWEVLDNKKFNTSKIKDKIDLLDLVLGKYFYYLTDEEILYIMNYDKEVRGGAQLKNNKNIQEKINLLIGE